MRDAYMFSVVVMNVLSGLALLAAGCGSSDDIKLEDLPEEVRYPCRVVEDEMTGGAVIQCTDGTSAVVRGGRTGAAGEDGAGCTVEAGAGEHTIRCADGTSAVVRDGAGCELEDRAGQMFLVCAGGDEVNLSQGGQGMGAGSCTTLMGSAVIWNELDIAELERAGCTAVGGDLRIEAGALESLAGLSKLTRVGGDLVIRGNTALETLAGLEQLEAVGGRVVIEDNEALRTLEALGGIGGAAGQELDALIIRDNYGLDGLDGLEWVRGAREALILEGFEIDTLAPLSGLAGDVRHVRVAETSALEDLEGLGGIRRVEVLELERNGSLTDMSALEVTRVYERLVIAYNTQLTAVGGLQAIEEDTSSQVPVKALGDVLIEGNMGLVDLRGLEGIQSIERLVVRNNGALTGFWTQFMGPTRFSSLVIEGNRALVEIDGFYMIYSIPELIIRDNVALTTMRFDSIGVLGTFVFEGNDAFVGAQSAFLGLTTVERLTVERNAALTSLGFLGFSVTVLEQLRVVGNQQLPTCEVDALLTPRGPDLRAPGRVEVWRNGSSFGCP